MLSGQVLRSHILLLFGSADFHIQSKDVNSLSRGLIFHGAGRLTGCGQA
jgi:hypothetical protein